MSSWYLSLSLALRAVFKSVLMRCNKGAVASLAIVRLGAGEESVKHAPLARSDALESMLLYPEERKLFLSASTDTAASNLYFTIYHLQQWPPVELSAGNNSLAPAQSITQFALDRIESPASLRGEGR